MNATFAQYRAFAPSKLMRAVIGAAVMLLCLSGSTPVFAQTIPLPNQINLRDSQDSYDLGPSLFLLQDTEQGLSYDQVVARYRSGERADMIDGSVVNLGSKPRAHWMIVPLSNDSWTEEWMLSFGGNLSGRLGQMGKIFVYDDISRARFIDTVNLTNNPYMAEGAMMGAALPLRLPRGKQALLVMYVMPEAGLPVLIAPKLVTANAYMKSINNPFSSSRLLVAGFMIMIGFFFGTVMFRRMWSSCIFMLYYALLMVLFQMQNDMAFTKFPFASELTGILFGLTVIAGIVSAGLFLDIRRFYRVQNKAMMGFVIGILLAALGAAFVVSDNLWAKPAMMMLPSFLGLIFISLLGLAQAQSGKYAAYQFSIAWFFVVVGFFITLLSTTGILTPSPVLVGAFWLSLLPQAILLISATVTRGILAERDEELEQEHMESEVESIALLKQSRDASENARLLRVIEHERQVMNELREREIKQSEDMRSARDLADEANRAKSAFLAVISHEIRTPMSGIMGMVRLLLDTKLSKEQHDYAQTIQDSGDAMLSLLNDILDFEKIESGKMDLEHIDFDLPRLVQGVVTLMSGHADAKGITLKMDMDPALPRFIVGDPVRLRQVMLNLVGNSIKFTEHGGVTILVKRDQSGEQRQGIVRIRLAVQDTGVGISREAQKNLFNPFAQADSSVSRRFGGTGLGLAISQRLIEAMGGRIAIDSTEGRGSTFYFTLMVEEGSADNAETVRGMTAAALAQKPDKVMRILVVEDNEISQKLMREFVQRLGHDITLAGSGEAALEHVNKGTFDMVLMDVELPGISGMGATKAIRALADKTKASLPVVAMTGNVRDEDVHNCYAANMNGHLAKPIDPQKLKEAIQKVIDNRLDNPVVVEESDGEYRQPQETEIKMSVDTLAAASALGLESGPGQKQDSRKDVAPIRELLLDPSTFQLDEDDLDMDSFAEAITRHEKSGTPDTEAGSVFDSRMLNGLRDGMNPDAVNKLIEEMFEKTDQIVTDLTAAVSANEIQIMGARAHELKGMAGNFGLVEVSKLAEKAERAAKEHTTEDLDMIVEALPQACKRAHNAMTLWQKGEWLD